MHKIILLLSLLSLSAVASERGAIAEQRPSTQSEIRKYLGFAIAGAAFRAGFLLVDYLHNHIIKQPENKIINASKQAQIISDLQHEINNDTDQLCRFNKIVASITPSDPDYVRLHKHAKLWQNSNKTRCEQIVKLTAKHLENNQSLFI